MIIVMISVDTCLNNKSIQGLCGLILKDSNKEQGEALICYGVLCLSHEWDILGIFFAISFPTTDNTELQVNNTPT